MQNNINPCGGDKANGSAGQPGDPQVAWTADCLARQCEARENKNGNGDHGKSPEATHPPEPPSRTFPAEPMKARQWAEMYLGQGWQPLALRPSSKKPFTNEWSARRLVSKDLPEEFSNRKSNLGIMLGSASAGLFDVDVDSAEALALANTFLPETGAVFGRKSKPRSHHFYRCSGADQRTRQFRDPTIGKDDSKAMLIELRGGGGQTMAPPSIHPDGEPLEWTSKEIKPAEIPYEKVLRGVQKTAAGALLVRYYPREGSRHQTALALAGALLDGVFAAEEAQQFIKAVACAAGDEESDDRVAAVTSTKRRLDAGEPVTGGRTCEEVFGERVWSSVRSWLELRDSGTDSAVNSSTAGTFVWEEPQAIKNELPTVIPMTPDLILPQFRTWDLDIADRMSVPADVVVVARIIAAASLIAGKLWVRPKARDDGWTISPTLWGLVASTPGVIIKSQSLKQGLADLEKLQEAERERFDLKGFDAEVRSAKLKALRATIDRLTKQGAGDGEIEKYRDEFNDLKREPRRAVVSDVTVEKLGEIFENNPSLLLTRDEFMALFMTLEREGHESDKGFFIESWEPAGTFHVDRIGRGSAAIPERFLSMIGSIQPHVLTQYLKRGLQAGDDGFAPRFQMMIQPDIGPWRHIDREPNREAQQQVSDLFQKLWRLNPSEVGAQQDPHERRRWFLRFAPEAQPHFDEWYGDLEQEIRRGGAHPLLTQHISKYRSLIPKLALVAQVIENLGRERPGNAVSLDNLKFAIRWSKYLRSHACRAYHGVIYGAEAAAQALAARILKKQLTSPFHLRQVYRSQWTGLQSREDAETATELLIDAGWLKRSEEDRRSIVFVINPRVYEIQQANHKASHVSHVSSFS